MKNYLFISNGRKNSNEYLSKENVTLKNMSKCCIIPAIKHKYNVYMAYNRKYAEDIKVNDLDVKLYNSNIYRSIFNIKDNYIAYKNLDKFLSTHKIDVIHCNTPIGGVLGRICGSKHKTNKIIYTVHGFHFFKGNSKIKNFIFYNIEKILAKKTDNIITINKEDYEAAKKFKLKNNGKVYLTHGVGINIEKFKNQKINIVQKRKSLNFKITDTIIISVGDVNKNKNCSLALDILKECNNSSIKYIICGTGPEIKKLTKKAEKLNLTNQVFFLGYRNDIDELLKISDIYLSTSKREGLPRSLMEAMAAEVPCVVSNIRGNKDLIDNEKGGFTCNGIDEYVSAINEIINNKDLIAKIKEYNNNKIKQYDYINIEKEISKIYDEILD